MATIIPADIAEFKTEGEERFCTIFTLQIIYYAIM